MNGPHHYIPVLLLGLFTGAVSTLTGGGSLFSIPALIFLGLPAPIAVATNRFGLTGMSLIGFYKFHKQKLIDYKAGLFIAVPATLGSVVGVTLVLEIDPDLLRRMIGFISLAVVFFLFLNRKAGLEKKENTVSNSPLKRLLMITFCFFWGIYGGFYGAAFATILNFLLIGFFGQTFIQSAATHKVAMVTLCCLSSVLFAIGGAIEYGYGITLFIGMSIGSYFGAHYAERIGNLWIRRLFLILGALMALKLTF